MQYYRPGIRATGKVMQIGMIGLGRMGANMVRRLAKGGHECVVFDAAPGAAGGLADIKVAAAKSLDDFVRKLAAPRAIWLMIPVAHVDAAIAELLPKLAAGDVIIDGGNSHYVEDLRRAKDLSAKGIHYVDVGTSGGVWGLERGYCLMIGGEAATVKRLDPVFATLSPEGGHLHCGPSGAGHFVKMVHNGIEYGLMAAYAEGLGILNAANIGNKTHAADAETTPLAHPEHYRYDFDLAAITEVWRHGSVVSSWLLDLTAGALAADPALSKFKGQVSDSGEGRWTIKAAIDEAVPAPVLTAALYERFSSRGEADFQNKVLSAMRFAFGGHSEKH
jgi:6-phosphogluconate dehydrogenase